MIEIMQSKKVKIVAVIVGLVAISVASMAVGVAVGLHKAKFSYRWGENYERNFIGKPVGGHGMMFSGPERNEWGERMGMRGMHGGAFRNPHGIAGSILSLSENLMVVKDGNNQENTISISDSTLIKFGGETISKSDLKEGDRIVVLGKPGDDGVVKAALIRIFDRTEQQ